jgi:UDP-N-acetylglucosamine:LPS N-acetylglucosamine transferase
MKVLGIVSYKVFPAKMGGQKGIALFYQYLSKQCEVELVASKENNLTEINFCNAHNFLFNHWKGWLNFFYIRRLIKLIQQKNIDVIIIEHSYFGWLGNLLKRFTGRPFIIHSHNIEAHRFKIAGKFWWKLYERYERRIHQKASYNFFICEEDKQYAINEWKLKESKCTTITYGTELSYPPSIDEKNKCRNYLIQKHSLQNDATIFLFNGTLDYAPNIDSLNIILTELIPLLNKENCNYSIIISGNRLSNEWKEKLNSYSEIILTGFVDDIDIYFKGCDAFIQPSSLGTGIKAKLIEALANNLTVISTEYSVRGINKTTVDSKLIVVPDNDWQGFAEEMMKVNIHSLQQIPKVFYKEFYWENIISKALLSLRRL